MRDLTQLNLESSLTNNVTNPGSTMADINPATSCSKDLLVKGTTAVPSSISNDVSSTLVDKEYLTVLDVVENMTINPINALIPEQFDLFEESATATQFIDLNDLPDESNIISSSTSIFEEQTEDLSLTFADDEYVSTFVLDVSPKIKNYVGHCKYDVLTSALTYCFDLCFSAYSFGTVGLLVLLYLYTSIMQTTALTSLFNTIIKLSSKNRRNFIEATIKYYKGTRRIKVFISTVYLSIF